VHDFHDVRLRGRREVNRRGSKLRAREVKTYKHTIATSHQGDGKDDYLGDMEEDFCQVSSLEKSIQCVKI
jgi:hypothetical protein